MNWELLLVAAVLLAILFELRGIRATTTSIDARIRERNAALSRAIAEDTRRHLRAIDSGSGPLSPLKGRPNPTRTNW